MIGQVLAKKRVKVVPGKVGHLAHLLEQRIEAGEFGIGHKFLSAREIVDHYGISIGTVQKSLKYLVQLGRLESVRGSGFYIRDFEKVDSGVAAEAGSQAAVKDALLVVVDSVGEYGCDLFKEYCDALRVACQREGWDILVAHNTAGEIAAVCDGRRLAGCLAYSLSKPLSVDVDPSRVIVMWASTWYSPEYSLLCVDGDAISQLAFNHLCDLGHKQMALVRGIPNGYMRQEDAGFLLGMRKAFASVGQAWQSEYVIDIDPVKAGELYQRLRRGGITGVYCSDWTIAAMLYQQAAECGESIGSDLSLVASGGADIRRQLNPLPSRVYWRFADFASIVVDAFRGCQEGRNIPHRLVIPAFLEIGRSAVPYIP